MVRSDSPEPTARGGKDVGVPTRFAQRLPSPVPSHPVDDLLTVERADTFRQVLARRTGRIAVVLEDCYDPHNATAVMRTCDAFGIMRVHCTTGRSRLKINSRVSQGAHRYLDLRIHEAIPAAYASLRADGFRIMVSDLKADAVVGPQHLSTILDERPLAVVFGSEGFGISDGPAPPRPGPLRGDPPRPVQLRRLLLAPRPRRDGHRQPLGVGGDHALRLAR